MVLTTLAWLCAVVASAGLLMEAINLVDFRRIAPQATEGDVVACVAMRNEARNAEACIVSLLAQSQIRAIVVCDDGSADETGAILRRIAEREQRVTVVSSDGGLDTTSKPKARALALAVQKARGMAPAHFFFTDADVRMERGAIGALLLFGRERAAEVVSAWPRQRVRTLWDALFAPIVVLFLLQALPMRATRGTDRRFAAANGQLLLVERNAYERSGGHAATQGYVEDVELARLLRKSGARIALASAADIASVETYGSLRENVRGWGRSLYFGSGAGGCVIFGLWQLCAFVLPWTFFVVSPPAFAIGVCASIAARALASRQMGSTPLQIIQTPLGGLFAAFAAFSARADGARNRFSWRDRPLDDRRSWSGP